MIDFQRGNMSNSIEQHPMVRRLKTIRFVFGVLSTLVSIGSLYAVLSVTFQVDLSASDGGQFVFQYWSGEQWWWLVLAALGIGVGSLTTDQFDSNPEAVQIFPRGEEIPDWLPETENICQMVEELSREMEVEIDRVYVANKHIPNAFASLVLQRGHIIILYRNLLEIMDRDSLKSVLAHECAHAKGDDVRHRMINILPRLLMVWIVLLKGIQLCGVLLLASDLWSLGVRLFSLVVYIILVNILFRFLGWFENQYSQVKENLADIYGAAHASVEGSINAFLRLNDRSHTLELLESVLKERFEAVDTKSLLLAVKTFPTGAKDIDQITEMITRSYVAAKVATLCQGLDLEGEDRLDMIEDMTNELLSHLPQVQMDEKSLVDEPFAWQQFDWNHDGFLQIDELSAMVTKLREDPKALTNGEGSGTHPPMRERILLLADVFIPESHKV